MAGGPSTQPPTYRHAVLGHDLRNQPPKFALFVRRVSVVEIVRQGDKTLATGTFGA